MPWLSWLNTAELLLQVPLGLALYLSKQMLQEYLARVMEHRVAISAVRLSYAQYAEGEPVVFVHGSNADHRFGGFCRYGIL